GETLLAEEIVALACTGTAEAPTWLAPDVGEQLLAARPERNLVATAIDQQLALLLPVLPKLQIALEAVASERASLQLAAHERVREAARAKGRVSIAPVLPVDILGAYVLLPRLG
ncbi:MAG: helicase SNF2, partial [Phycisphaerae bacterium]|nr:helicase SNF2 [Phycisphaerae bacterium]